MTMKTWRIGGGGRAAAVAAWISGAPRTSTASHAAIRHARARCNNMMLATRAPMAGDDFELQPVAQFGELQALILHRRAQTVFPGQAAIIWLMHQLPQLGDELLQLAAALEQRLRQQR